jgi:TetR/AcrR family fatty acid metabolism transcriptional regulator
MSAERLRCRMDKKEIIRRAAIKVFARDGFFNTKMQSISCEAGIAIGTLYLYFSSKEDILNYIFMVEYKKRLNLSKKLDEQNLSGLQKIESYLMLNIDQLKIDPDTTKVIFQEALDPSQRKLEWISKMYTDLPLLYIEALKQAKNDGEVHDLDPELTGTTFFYISKTLTYMLLIDKAEITDHTANQIIKLLMNGIRNS